MVLKKIMIFRVVYHSFSLWLLVLGKLHFTNPDNPKESKSDLDCTDYGCEIHLLQQPDTTKTRNASNHKQEPTS